MLKTASVTGALLLITCIITMATVWRVTITREAMIPSSLVLGSLSDVPVLHRFAQCDQFKNRVVRIVGMPGFNYAGNVIRFDGHSVKIVDFDWPFDREHGARTVELIATLRHTGPIPLSPAEEAELKRREEVTVDVSSYKTGWFYLENAYCRVGEGEIKGVRSEWHCRLGFA